MSKLIILSLICYLLFKFFKIVFSFLSKFNTMKSSEKKEKNINTFQDKFKSDIIDTDFEEIENKKDK